MNGLDALWKTFEMSRPLIFVFCSIVLYTKISSMREAKKTRERLAGELHQLRKEGLL